MYSILHLIPSLAGGGAERQLALLAEEQATRGFDVHIGIRRGGVHEKKLHRSKAVIHRLGDHKGLSLMLSLRISALIREVQPDLVQTWLPQMDVLGGIAALWNGVPWIVSERASELASRNSRVSAWIRRRLGRHASAVIANSAAGAMYWRKMLPSDRRVSKVSNAVDAAAVRGAPLAVDTSWSEEKKLFLVVGRLDYQKAVEVTVHGFSRIADRDDFRVLIIGDGPLRSELEVIVRSAALNDRIVIYPYLAEWWGLLKVASGLVSMSRYEGHPNVVLEAMAASCPLIVSDIPEHREFLSEESAILVQPDNSIALAEAIASLLGDPVSACQRAKHAASRVTCLTIHAMADAYDSIYKQVIAERLR